MYVYYTENKYSIDFVVNGVTVNKIILKLNNRNWNRVWNVFCKLDSDVTRDVTNLFKSYCTIIFSFLISCPQIQ